MGSQRPVLLGFTLFLVLLAEFSSHAEAASSRSKHTDNSKPSTCQFRTANYITHGLPQQCLKTASPSIAVSRDRTAVVQEQVVKSADNAVHGKQDTSKKNVSSDPKPNASTRTRLKTPVSSTQTVQPTESPEDDPDSLLDTPNFLSFEEWKNQNLAKAGQSAENFNGKDKSPREARRRPDSRSALDSIGDDAEISLDDFGSESDSSQTQDDEQSNLSVREKPSETVPPQSHTRSKDAGKTCKERFNYASFDCAATVHRSNPEARGVSRILVESKDSYMLNKCDAKNKFIIIELCDDILVDTIVLANYEFFSSMFRSFRVSVSDRYPVKAAGWRDLGTYEARNSREVQAFLIENPLIWARYMRVEFLTHYGAEYYCPLSLLRIHGTTMMEEFSLAQEEAARGEHDEEGDGEGEDVEPEAFDTSLEVVIREQRVEKEAREESQRIKLEEEVKITAEFASPTKMRVTSSGDETFVMPKPTAVPVKTSDNTRAVARLFSKSEMENVCARIHTPTTTRSAQSSTRTSSTTTCQDINQKPKTASGSSISTVPISSQVKYIPTNSSASSKVFSAKSQSTSMVVPLNRQNATSAEQQQKKPASSTTSIHSSSPTTQESFFKTIHKRLQLLEANATLSLQYIEEQSRILRDAFSKMEKRQLSKTSNYLDQLNSTIMRELQGFRKQYDQLWQSTVIALETQKDVSEREMVAISTRLAVLADEVIFQKRMSIIQSVLLVIAIGLVLFSRSPHLHPPLVSTNTLSNNLRHPFESPPRSPSPPMIRTKRTRDASVQEFVHSNNFRKHHRRTSSDISIMSGVSDVYANPDDEGRERYEYSSPTTEAMTVQSGPATPSGLTSGEDREREITWTRDRKWRPRSPLANEDEEDDEIVELAGLEDDEDNADGGEEDIGENILLHGQGSRSMPDLRLGSMLDDDDEKEDKNIGKPVEDAEMEKEETTVPDVRV